MAFRFALIALLIVSAGAQDDACPEKNGYFADSEQCDRYYECKNHDLTEKLCPDGLVYADNGQDKCDFPFNVDCRDRPKLQPQQPSTNCPRRNGYFPHPDPKVCNQFFFCSDGQFNLITCPEGLVFNEKTGTCSWPGEANRVGCSSTEIVKFECPERTDDSIGLANPLYADPEDCQYFYVCINSKEPRRNGCTTGLVFNDETKRCDKPKNVPDCKDWYKKNAPEHEEDESEEEVEVRPANKKQSTRS